MTDADDTTVRPKVLRWGPYPHQDGVFGGGIGGYARYNSQALRSLLVERADIVPLSMTVPRFRDPALFRLHLAWRMIVDVVTVTWALLRVRPDVLHITALYWRSIYREAYAVWIARRLGVAVLYDIRAGTFAEFMRDGGTLERRLARYVVTRSTRVAIQGRGVIPALRERYGVEAAWIPNCFLDADLERYRPAPLCEPEAGEPLRLAFVGYLIPEKGVDTLLEAAERLSRDGPVEVTLIGEVAPRFRATLEAYQGRQSDTFRIVATGRLELEELLERLREQHLFVFLSRFFGEGHPNAVTEAMAMGLPVIASRQGFLPDIVTEECGVVLSDPTDVEAAASAIAQLRDDWSRLRELGRGSRRRIERVFSESVVLETTARLYRECAASAEDRA